MKWDRVQQVRKHNRLTFVTQKSQWSPRISAGMRLPTIYCALIGAARYVYLAGIGWCVAAARRCRAEVDVRFTHSKQELFVVVAAAVGAHARAQDRVSGALGALWRRIELAKLS